MLDCKPVISVNYYHNILLLYYHGPDTILTTINLDFFLIHRSGAAIASRAIIGIVYPVHKIPTAAQPDEAKEKSFTTIYHIHEVYRGVTLQRTRLQEGLAFEDIGPSLGLSGEDQGREWASGQTPMPGR